MALEGANMSPLLTSPLRPIETHPTLSSPHHFPLLSPSSLRDENTLTLILRFYVFASKISLDGKELKP
ncbi:hypothetical protein E2C01_038224 [Portunus trituberculatus]|uniref:Uncharacterized protein n=1 Tax=Portunus trituberculatus TaxID=210409 RepID=A0A5B7FAA8_PORTR|nr:hypothetical protein [Portunus trituberculatus]